MANTSHPILPDNIEIFKAGTRIADDGAAHTITPADIAAAAKNYDPTVREAPLCVGHPKDNKPAFGWVSRLSATGDSLRMHVKDVVPQFAEMVNNKLYKARSSSFYHPKHPNNPTPGKWYLRHVAFLGAQQPAIAGLADFADAEDGVVNFSESLTQPQKEEIEPMPIPNKDAATPAATDTNKAALEAANKQVQDAQAAQAAAEAAAKEATDKLAQFAEAQQKQRTAEFIDFAEGLFKQGIFIPTDKSMAVAALNVVADAKPVEFSEGNTTKTLDLLQWLKTKLQAAAPQVQFGEHAPASATATAGGVRLHKDSSDADIDRAAQAYAKQHKVDYAEAVSAVVSFTQ